MKTDRENTLKHGALWAALLIVIVLAWDTWTVYPLKILVVFFHELSHGMMAYATGGSVEQMQLDSAQGGFCITRGGSPFLILMAGYLGSLAWGSLALLLASHTRSAKLTSAALGVMILIVGLMYIRPVIGFGFLFAGVAGAAMLLASAYLAPFVNTILLRVIGLTSCMYVILDIKSDTLDRSHLESDARMLADLTGIPTVIWGALWLLVAVATVYAILRIAVRSSRPTP
jgi:hypothetical protein